MARVVTVKLPGWLAEAAREAAAARRMYLSDLVREAVWRLLRSPPARLEAPSYIHVGVDAILTVKMGELLLERLDAAARMYRVRRAVVIREALWRHLVRLGVIPAQTEPPEPRVIKVLG